MNHSNSGQPDYSMLSRRWSGTKLITSQIALEIARQVHKQNRGEKDLASNEPLSVAQEGDTWVVTGSKIDKYDPNSQTLDGSLRMIVSQFDGQILSYMLAFVLPRYSAPPTSPGS
jgi:hypothetical protein